VLHYQHRFFISPARTLAGRVVIVDKATKRLERFIMTTTVNERFFWPTISLAGAIVLVAASCTVGEAGVYKVVPIKPTTAQQQKPTQQQKPITLRYYGGPKYPMYPG
jgi:hypothetical protein